jgi:hypothetical protein
MTVVALVLAQWVTFRELQQSRTEAEGVRYKYGDIRVQDDSKTSVFRFVNDDYGRALPEGIEADESFRLVVPSGARYVLHLSDVVEKKYAYPSRDALVPTETVVLDPGPSNIVISRFIRSKEKAPRIVVSSESKLLFDYVAANWKGGILSTTESWPDLSWAQTDFDSDATIRLCWWSADNANRGFMLWLEPHEKWLQRSGAEQVATAQPDESEQ